MYEGQTNNMRSPREEDFIEIGGFPPRDPFDTTATEESADDALRTCGTRDEGEVKLCRVKRHRTSSSDRCQHASNTAVRALDNNCEATLKINVDFFVGGRRLVFIVKQNCTVEELKTVIERHSGILVKDQNLVFPIGKRGPRGDSSTLSQHDVVADDVIHLVVKLEAAGGGEVFEVHGGAPRNGGVRHNFFPKLISQEAQTFSDMEASALIIDVSSAAPWGIDHASKLKATLASVQSMKDDMEAGPDGDCDKLLILVADGPDGVRMGFRHTGIGSQQCAIMAGHITPAQLKSFAVEAKQNHRKNTAKALQVLKDNPDVDPEGDTDGEGEKEGGEGEREVEDGEDEHAQHPPNNTMPTMSESGPSQGGHSQGPTERFESRNVTGDPTWHPYKPPPSRDRLFAAARGRYAGVQFAREVCEKLGGETIEDVDRLEEVLKNHLVSEKGSKVCKTGKVTVVLFVCPNADVGMLTLAWALHERDPIMIGNDSDFRCASRRQIKKMPRTKWLDAGQVLTEPAMPTVEERVEAYVIFWTSNSGVGCDDGKGWKRVQGISKGWGRSTSMRFRTSAGVKKVIENLPGFDVIDIMSTMLAYHGSLDTTSSSDMARVAFETCAQLMWPLMPGRETSPAVKIHDFLGRFVKGKQGGNRLERFLNPVLESPVMSRAFEQWSCMDRTAQWNRIIGHVKQRQGRVNGGDALSQCESAEAESAGGEDDSLFRYDVIHGQIVDHGKLGPVVQPTEDDVIYDGVRFMTPGCRYHFEFSHESKTYSCGTFETAELAARARDLMIRALDIIMIKGLNFPTEDEKIQLRDDVPVINSIGGTSFDRGPSGPVTQTGEVHRGVYFCRTRCRYKASVATKLGLVVTKQHVPGSFASSELAAIARDALIRHLDLAGGVMNRMFRPSPEEQECIDRADAALRTESNSIGKVAMERGDLSNPEARKDRYCAGVYYEDEHAKTNMRRSGKKNEGHVVETPAIGGGIRARIVLDNTHHVKKDWIVLSGFFQTERLASKARDDMIREAGLVMELRHRTGFSAGVQELTSDELIEFQHADEALEAHYKALGQMHPGRPDEWGDYTMYGEGVTPYHGVKLQVFNDAPWHARAGSGYFVERFVIDGVAIFTDGFFKDPKSAVLARDRSIRDAEVVVALAAKGTGVRFPNPRFPSISVEAEVAALKVEQARLANTKTSRSRKPSPKGESNPKSRRT